MQPHLLVSFTLACILLNLVPGPGMMFMIAHGVTGGRRAGVAAAFGMASGTSVHTVAAALGLSALLAAATVTPRSSPVSLAENRSTSRSTRTARCWGGSSWIAIR